MAVKRCLRFDGHTANINPVKFTISLQYLKKEVRNGVHFLHEDKH